MNAEEKFAIVLIGLILYGLAIFLFEWTLVQVGPSLAESTGFGYIMSAFLLVVGSICLAYSFSDESKKAS